MAAIDEVMQSMSAGELVTLYILDATNIGGELYRFTPMVNDNYTHVEYGGNVYAAIDIEEDGFEWSSTGALPQPTFRISNASKILQYSIVALNDLIGAKITRIRTFSKFLDNGATPDANAHFPLDVYRIDQKTFHNKSIIEFKLVTLLDAENKKLPGRQVLRDVCTHRYRRWNANTLSFDYTEATCPYNGANYFDKDGNVVTDPAQDMCSKRTESGCKKRFTGNVALPTRAFPGVARVRL